METIAFYTGVQKAHIEELRKVLSRTDMPDYARGKIKELIDGMEEVNDEIFKRHQQDEKEKR